jgi:hypothetical protein
MFFTSLKGGNKSDSRNEPKLFTLYCDLNNSQFTVRYHDGRRKMTLLHHVVLMRHIRNCYVLQYEGWTFSEA